MSRRKNARACAIDRRGMPPLREPTASPFDRIRAGRSEAEEKVSVHFGRNDGLGGRLKLLQPQNLLLFEQALVAQDAADFFRRDGKSRGDAGDFAILAAPHFGNDDGGEFFADLLEGFAADDALGPLAQSGVDIACAAEFAF